jgi:16S rRNA (guanine527-N7)-methyltransferase
VARDTRSRLQKRAFRAGIFLNDELVDSLIAYYELLYRWNRKINLTALTDGDQAIDRLLVEPVLAARYLPSFPAFRHIDIGSGGGSPAIPMYLAVSGMELRMVEVKARKSAFLREAVRQLSLRRAVVENATYEELLARPELHESGQSVSVRAVRVEARVLTTLQAFLAVGGRLLLFRGPTGPNEPGVIVPPLAWTGTYPLIDTLQSRLTVLSKSIR